MAGPYLYDRVKETTKTTGTGTVTLAGAVTGFISFSVVGNSNTCYYTIEDGSSWEVGVGTYTSSGTTLSRDKILASSNSGSAVSFGAGTKNVYLTAPAGILVQPLVNDFRLTLTTAVPVTTTDVTGATTIYLTPAGGGNRIALYNGNSWDVLFSAEVSLALGTLTSGKNYDIFAFNSSGTLTLEFLVWTNDTTRATALVLQDGAYCKTGALARRYVGTFRTTSTTATEDSTHKRYLWNAYNQKRRILLTLWQTVNATDTNAAWHQCNSGDSANQIEIVTGLPGVAVNLTNLQRMDNGAGSSGGSVSIGIDSTSAVDARSSASFTTAAGANGMTATFAGGFATPGYHALYPLIQGAASGSPTFYGAAIYQSLSGSLEG